MFAGSHGVEPTAHEAGPGAINAGLFNLMRQISMLYGPQGIAWAVTMLLDPEADIMHGGVLKLDAGGLNGIF